MPAPETNPIQILMKSNGKRRRSHRPSLNKYDRNYIVTDPSEQLSFLKENMVEMELVNHDIQNTLTFLRYNKMQRHREDNNNPFQDFDPMFGSFVPDMTQTD
mmetsp:Transcript_11227/g.18898  ORF Transcript_11227/g.18898 Transcript_11227/m.18898 type:complete len:102 (+) Transcript_11227:59-364(+)